MHLPANKNYQTLFTQIIQDTMVVLGPEITLAKMRKITSLTITDDGTVTSIPTNPKRSLQDIVGAFITLCPFLTEKMIAAFYN